MGQIFVSGLINIETTLAVDAFPIEYEPVRYPFFGVRSTVSGVGVNIAAALTTLGREVRLASIVGRDAEAVRARDDLVQRGVDPGLVLDVVEQTATAVILYDPSGRRLINTDLKDIQDASYPLEVATAAITASDAAVLCNINFSRPLLNVARELGKPVFTDVHALGDPDDDYNADFMRAADVLFLSNELFIGRERELVGELRGRFASPLVVVGLGAEGALLFDAADDSFTHEGAVAHPLQNGRWLFWIANGVTRTVPAPGPFAGRSGAPST